LEAKKRTTKIHDLSLVFKTGRPTISAVFCFLKNDETLQKFPVLHLEMKTGRENVPVSKPD
jgi:hypothetical protein